MNATVKQLKAFLTEFDPDDSVELHAYGGEYWAEIWFSRAGIKHTFVLDDDTRAAQDAEEA